MQKQKEKEAHEAYMNSLPPTVPMTNEEIEQLVFSIEGDKPEKTQRSDVPNKKKKKKGKKK
jgi:hypothetical protein